MIASPIARFCEQLHSVADSLSVLLIGKTSVERSKTRKKSDDRREEYYASTEGWKSTSHGKLNQEIHDAGFQICLILDNRWLLIILFVLLWCSKLEDALMERDEISWLVARNRWAFPCPNQLAAVQFRNALAELLICSYRICRWNKLQKLPRVSSVNLKRSWIASDATMWDLHWRKTKLCENHRELRHWRKATPLRNHRELQGRRHRK